MKLYWANKSLQSLPRLKNQQCFQKGRTLHITSVATLEMSVIAECVPWKALALGYEMRKTTLVL